MTTTKYIDPRVVFLKLSENPSFMEPIAHHLGYPMGDMKYEDDRLAFIYRMVTCENNSRYKDGIDTLLIHYTKQYAAPISVRDPAHALHIILRGVHYDFRPSKPEDDPISQSAMDKFMMILYALMAKVEFESRTNYRGRRGTFPVLKAENMHTAFICLKELEDSMVWLLIALLSNVDKRDNSMSRSDLINTIITGDCNDITMTHSRYLNAKKSNALELYHSIPGYMRKKCMDLMPVLDPGDITSFNLLSTLMDKCYFMEWKQGCALESLLSSKDLNIPTHCKLLIEQLDMILPADIWISKSKIDSDAEFLDRLKSYAHVFMTDLEEFTDFKVKAKNTPIKKALHVHFMKDKQMYAAFGRFEFGNSRSVYAYMCIMSLIKPNYVKRTEGIKLDNNQCFLSYLTLDVRVNDYINQWLTYKHGGLKVNGNLAGVEYLLGRDDYVFHQPFDKTLVEANEVPITEWANKSPLLVANQTLSQPYTLDKTSTVFSVKDLMSLHIILDDTAYFASHQRMILAHIIQPILQIDSERKYPVNYFLDMNQTDRNVITGIMDHVMKVANKLMTLKAPNSWPNQRAPCAINSIKSLNICRRHIAKLVLKITELTRKLDKRCLSFLSNLLCYNFNNNAVMEQVPTRVGYILYLLETITIEVWGMLGPNVQSESLDGSDSEGDGGLNPSKNWSIRNPNVADVSIQLNQWATMMTVSPNVIISTMTYYLSQFKRMLPTDTHFLVTQAATAQVGTPS